MKRSLNVFFVTGKDFIKYLSVSITSLVETNKHLNLKIFIIYDFDNKDALEKIVDFAHGNYGVPVRLIYFDGSLFDNYKTSSHVYKATYYRLLIADIIPKEVESGLFIDSDTIVTGSLEELAAIEFSDIDDRGNESNKYLYAVSEIEVERRLNSERLTKLGYKTDKYFNAGVMLVNLKNWRLTNTTTKLMEIAERHNSDFVYMDQDVLNTYFVNKWGELSSSYNALHLIRQLPKVPLIVHFAGPSKPWNYMNNHPYKDLYLKYFKLSPYKDSGKFVDFSWGKVLKKHIYETRDYINYYRSGEYRKVQKTV